MIQLKLAMFGTLALLIGISTLFFSAVLTVAGGFSLFPMIFLVVAINLVQWLIAPYLIDRLYHAKEVSESEHPGLYRMVRSICQKTNFPLPRIMLANIPIPNAFAYGSPIAGRRVAVTTELLKTLEEEEVEAVVGHEIGHLKNRDTQIMMFASVLPAIFFYLGYSLMLSGRFGGRDRNAGSAVLIGIAAMALYWVLSLFVMGLSRLREYYADAHAVKYVSDGGRKLSEGLAKIVVSTGRYKAHKVDAAGSGAFRALFISDPESAMKDELVIHRQGLGKTDSALVQEILDRNFTRADRLMELFSTHPNIVKRLRAVKKLRSTQTG